MFAYCNSNPVIHVDYTGREFENVLNRDLGMGYGMGYGMAGICVISIPFMEKIADALVVLAQDVVDTVSVAVENIKSKVEEKKLITYSVYFLQDQTGTIQYVGRVKDDGYNARMSYHARTRGLNPKHRISGLTKEEARGLEEIGMISCHTLNPLNKINNQIHGISPKNKHLELYMDAAYNYLYNRAEDWVINIFE